MYVELFEDFTVGVGKNVDDSRVHNQPCSGSFCCCFISDRYANAYVSATISVDCKNYGRES